MRKGVSRYIPVSSGCPSWLGRCQRLVVWIWNSPSATSLASYIAQSAGIAVFLPLMVRILPPEEVSVILLFSAISALRLLLDFGFSYTFMRHLSYALATRIDETGLNDSSKYTDEQFAMVGTLKVIMKRIYFLLGFAMFIFLATGGTYLVSDAINSCAAPSRSWYAWLTVIVTTAFTTWGIQYSTWLQGTENVALLRRWETFFSCLSPISAAGAIFFGGGVLSVTMVQSLWQFLGVARNWLLSTQIEDRLWHRFQTTNNVGLFFSKIWSQSWRTGVGVLCSFGVVQGAALAFAKILDGSALASFLVAYRLITAINDASKAPFYSRTPELFRFFVEADKKSFFKLARISMRESYLLFAAAWVIVAVGLEPVLNIIGSQTPAPSLLLWAALGIAFLLQRCGAMHMQIVCAADRILIHRSDGGTALVFLICLPLLIQPLGSLALPTALILAYSLFYVPYAARHSRQIIGMDFWKLEYRGFLPAFLIVAIGAAVCGLAEAW